MKQVGFALMGCGRISGKHVDALTSGLIPGARIVAVCDPRTERSQNVALKLDVPAFSSLGDMMEKVGSAIDVVSVLTPSGMHADHCCEVARHKKHVVVEKPMALTLSDADRMISACRTQGVQLFVVKQNRFNKPVQALRKAFDGGRFGKIVSGAVRVRWCRPQAYYDQDEWRGTWKWDGGVFANQASHHIDLLEWFLGEPKKVFAVSRQALARVQTEDTAFALIEFANGSLGSVEATTAARPKDLEGSLSLLGEGGSVEIAGFAVNEVRTWNFVDRFPGDEATIRDLSEIPPNVYGYGHQTFLKQVVQSIRGEIAPPVDGEEGRKSLRLISCMYESIEKGLPVEVGATGGSRRLGVEA